MAYLPFIVRLETQSRSDFIMHEDDADDDQMGNNGVAPMSFDRIYNGHITTSRFPLFRMPVELFEYVTRWLSKRDLLALGLVDRDCSKLAALTLFKKVQVEQLPPPSTLSPIASLAREVDLLKGNLTPYSSSLTNFITCVRQIVIRPSTMPSYMDNAVDHNAMSMESYTGDILFPSGQTMPSNRIFSPTFPNLHTFHWDGPSFSTSDIMRCLFYLPLRHLHFRGMVTDPENNESSAADDVDRTAISNIETLSLDVSWDSDRTNFEAKRIAFFQRVLLPVQSSLRRLIWRGFHGYITGDEIIINSSDFNAPAFPNLRSLTLDGIAASDTTHIFRLFLGNNDTTRIRSLSIETATESSRVFLNTRGHIPSLRNLSVNGHDRTPYPYEIFNFLEANAQLEALHLGILTPNPAIDDRLMPLLQGKFRMLRSLQLTFDGSPLDGSPISLDSLLQAISSLTALRQLWLSAGGSRDPRSWNWRVRHLDVAKFLTPLVNLELLAFSHDTYTVPMLHPLAPRRHGARDYYSSMALPTHVERGIARYLTPEEYLVYQGRDGAHADYENAMDKREKMRQQAWERWHAERMLEVVDCYAQSFRALRWCFVGQLSFSAVNPDTRYGVSQFKAERTKRDPSLIALRKNMGIDGWCPVIR